MYSLKVFLGYFLYKYIYSCIFKCVPALYPVFFCPKTPFSIVTYQNSSVLSRDSICIPLINRCWIEKIKLTSIKIFKIIVFILKLLKLFYKISSFQNMLQYITPHQPWPMELVELINSEKNRMWLVNTINPS